jgi:hypothetical protein
VLLLGAAAIPTALVGRIVLITLLPLEAIAMFMTPEFSTYRGGTIDSSAVAFLQQHTGLNRVYTLGPLQPNYGSYFGINSLNVNDLPVPKAFSHVVETKLDPNANPLLFTGTVENNSLGLTAAQALTRYLPNYERFGVKYVLVARGAPAPVQNPPLSLVYHDALIDIYELPHTRAFYSDATGRCSFSAMTYSGVSVECPTPAIITRNELEMPGWSASVNGRSTPVRADSDGLETVAVSAGVSKVAFRFEPPHTTIAVILAVLGLALCAGVGLLSRTLTPRRRPQHSSRRFTGPGRFRNSRWRDGEAVPEGAAAAPAGDGHESADSS